MDPALHADLRRAELDRLGDPLLELLLRDVVGVRRAPALAEAAESAADGADVGEVDVAVDHERGDVAGQVGAQAVGARPHRLDHLGPGLGEQRRQLVLGERLAADSLLDRRGSQLGIDRPLGAPAGPLARDEAPVLELHDVEDALLDPLRLEVLRIDAQPLGERVALWLQALADLVRARKRVLGRDVVAVRRQAAEVGRPLGDQLIPPVGEVRRDLDPGVRHQPLASRRPAASCLRA